MLVALVQPRIEISSETTRRKCARFHTFLRRLELAECLCTSGNVEAFVDADDFH